MAFSEERLIGLGTQRCDSPASPCLAKPDLRPIIL